MYPVPERAMKFTSGNYPAYLDQNQFRMFISRATMVVFFFVLTLCPISFGVSLPSSPIRVFLCILRAYRLYISLDDSNLSGLGSAWSSFGAVSFKGQDFLGRKVVIPAHSWPYQRNRSSLSFSCIGATLNAKWICHHNARLVRSVTWI